MSLWQREEPFSPQLSFFHNQQTTATKRKERELGSSFAPVMWKKGNAFERVYNFSKLMGDLKPACFKHVWRAIKG